MSGSSHAADPVAFLLTHLRGALPPAGAYWVAFSGGMDSHVLLHALAALRPELAVPVGAVHIHHGLQTAADAWADFCEQAARNLGIAYIDRRVEVPADHPQGLEAAAREARYRALEDWLPPGGALLTAHHQRDQAETLLLQLLRGAGPRGLAAMPARSDFGAGQLARPLLDVPYESLQAYAAAWGLDWVDDPSNRETHFDRNLLRQALMPGLRERWPALDRVLARAARHQATASHLLDDLARIDHRGAQGQQPNTLSVECLRALEPRRRDNLLRYWIGLQGLPLPAEAVLQRIPRELLESRADAEPCVHWGDAELRRYRGDLYLLDAQTDAPSDWQDGLPEQALELPGGGRLRVRGGQGLGIAAERLKDGEWRVRYRQGGERIRPAGRAHTRPLKHLLQEAGMPPWLRERVPLIYCDGQLAAVAQLWVAEGFAAAPDCPGKLFMWDRFGPLPVG